MSIQRFIPIASSAIMPSERGDYVRYSDYLEHLNLSPAAADVLAERQRQINVKGWTPEHDDTYTCGELAAAAISYIEPMEAENYWPADWHDDSFRPSDERRNIVKATALLLAELERLDRLSQRNQK
ncbi:TPA: hypothetical protein ACWV5P_002584 [Salmonella enterica subsp. enterica serovar Muenchen]